MKSRFLYIPFLIIAIVATGLFAFAVKTTHQAYTNSSVRSESTWGTLSDTKIKEETNEKGGTEYSTSATISFDVRGETYSDHVLIDGKHNDGDTHVIHYNPDDPSDCSIYSPGDLKWQMVMLGICCFIGVIVSIVLMVKIVCKKG